jgi:RNA polymerase sigma factor (sigma-70 family)
MSPLAISLRFLQTQPDQRLVELARAGHERAFEALVRRYRGPLLAYCRRVAPSGSSPEDILQQGLLQAWRALSGGAEVRDARAWLYRIVHNLAITALRASAERPEGVAAERGAPGVDQLVEQRMAAREALAGLAGLPDLQRQVMVSAAIDGRSHEEIAAALGLSSGSVRGLIYRARSTLRAAAAAVIPAPVIDWAVGDAGGASAGLAGAGSAGIGALIVKGGAIVAVGAAAGTTAIVVGDHSPHAHTRAAPVTITAKDSVDAGSAIATRTTGRARPASALLASVSQAGAGAAPFGGRDGGSRVRHDGPGDRGGRQPITSGGDGPGGGSDASRSGSDGGADHAGTPATTGSDGGGDHGTTTATTGSDRGGDHGATTATSGTDGGGDSSNTSTTTTTTITATSGSDGGGASSGSSDGGSSDGGTLSGSGGGSATTATTDGH